MKIKINEKEKVEEAFQERENFLDSLVDKKIYGWLCPVHNVWISKDISICPLCELERTHQIKYQAEGEEVQDNSYDDRIKERDRKRKAMLDPEKKKKHYEAVAKNQLKEKQRKKEHSY